ncbi:unnamed protein product [Schistosoma turkestanicum]|nr:unnamed protein product [Schistosoma turkestanicum]
MKAINPKNKVLVTYANNTRPYKTSNAICDYLDSFVQEHLCDINNYEKHSKNQLAAMENGEKINEDFIDTRLVLTLPNNIKAIFDFIKRSTNLAYRAKCWPKIYDAAKICWNATLLCSLLLSRLSVWCNKASIHREAEVKVEVNMKISSKSSRKAVNTEGEKYSIQAQKCNASVLEILHYLKQYTNRRALAKIAWTCWFMSADNILDLFEASLNQDEIAVRKYEHDTDYLNEQPGKFWRPEMINNQFNIDWNWLHCFILKTLEIICRASKWESLCFLGLKAVGILGKHWAPGILPFVIFGQNQIMERLKKQKTFNATMNDVNNIEEGNSDFSNLSNRSQMQLCSALYHYNFMQPKSEKTFQAENNDFINSCNTSISTYSLTSKQFLEFLNQCKTFKKATFPWTKNTVIDTTQKSNFNWTDITQQKSEKIKPVQPKVRMNGWLIPQSHLNDDQFVLKTRSMSEEELALCNIFVPLNSKITESELKEAECLHYSGIMNKIDQARLYQSILAYQLYLLTNNGSNQMQLEITSNRSFVTKLADLQNSVSQWDRKILFVTNSTEHSKRKIHENLLDHTIKFYNESLDLLTPHNSTLQEMMIRFEMLRFYLKVDHIKQATHQALIIINILFERKATLENLDLAINICDFENVMQKYSFRIIKRFGISGCLLGALVMGLLSKHSLISKNQACKCQMICAALFKSILHGSLPCAKRDFDYYNNSIPMESLRILKLDEIFTNYCFDLNNVIDVLDNTLNHLITHEHFTEAFPVVYLFHYIGKSLLKNTQLEIKAKLFQTKCLIGLGALKQSLVELCTILQEQTDNSAIHESSNSLVNFDDTKIQDYLNTLLTHKLSEQTIHKWGFRLFCEIQLIRAEVCYEIAKHIPYLPKKLLVENQMLSSIPNRNQVMKSSGRKAKNQERNIVRLLYEMDNQNSKPHFNFQANLKQLLFKCGSDICQIMINNIRDENSSENYKTSHHIGNVTQKQITQQSILNLWFQCRAELIRCQIKEVDGGRILKELTETENDETPKENDNLKLAFEEVKMFKSNEYWNEFTLLNNQLLFTRNKLGSEKIANNLMEEISLTGKCNQLLAYDIFHESDLVVQEVFRNISTVNDDSLLIQLEERLEILLNSQKALIKELNDCGESIENASLFHDTVAEIRLPIHKNWKNLIQIGLRVSLILLSLGDIKCTHSVNAQAKYMRENHPNCIRILALSALSAGEIYEEALSALKFSLNILNQLPPNYPCLECELLFVKGLLEMRLFLENKIDWQLPSQSWLRSICISAYVTGDKLFQHKTELMLAYFWQLVCVQQKCSHSVIENVPNLMDNKSRISLRRKQSEMILPNEIPRTNDSNGKFSQSANLCIWNILLMLDQFLSQRRQYSKSTTDFLHPTELNNKRKSMMFKLRKSESPKRPQLTSNKVIECDWSVMHQFDLVGKKCLDCVRVISPSDAEYELINVIQKSNHFDELFDYVKNQAVVSECWNFLFNPTSMVSDDNQLPSNQKLEWKKLEKIQLSMDTLKLYESILYENVLNVKQLFQQNEKNINGSCLSNCQDSQNEDCINKLLMQNLLIPVSPVPYYSQDAEYWFQRFTSLQVHLSELNASTETEAFDNLSNVINNAFDWFNEQTPENENAIRPYILPYNLNFELKSFVKLKSEPRRGLNKSSKYLLIQTTNNFESDNSFHKCLSILIGCYSPKAKFEGQLYQQRLVLFDNGDEFFNTIEQFNKMVIKYGATSSLSEREKTNLYIKSTASKSPSVKTNEKSLDSENMNQSDLEFQNEFSSWLDKFDKILRAGKILHNADQENGKSIEFAFAVPNLTIQPIQPTDEIFNSLKEIISWRYFGGSLIRSKLSQYITKLYRFIE